MRNFARLLPLVLALALSIPALADPPAYTVTDVAALPGQNYVNAHAINSQGQVGGSFFSPTGHDRAFVWTPGTGMLDLGQIADGNSVVNGLSASGQAVGSAPSGNTIQVYNPYTYKYDTYMTYYGFRTTSGGQITQSALIPPFGGYHSACYAINASGEIVGRTGTSQPFGGYDGPVRAFSFSPGQSTGTILPTLGGTYSAAYAVNDTGLVVGVAALYSASAYYPTHAALWQNGQITDLGTLGGQNSTAYGINAAGQIVGVSDTVAPISGAEPQHPFSWQNGQMTDLGLPLDGASGTAKAINVSGQVVGSGYSIGTYPNITQRALLWSGGKSYNLNTLVIGDTDWSLTDAAALNDSGQIVGSGTIGGKYHAFLLTPAPDSAPRVGTLSPNRARVGDGDLTVTVTGTGFASGAVVEWNGTSLATTFVSATQLTAFVPAANLAAPTQASVTVVNPAAGVVLGQLNFAVQPVGLLIGFDAGAATILAGNRSYGSVTLSQPAEAGGYAVTLLSSSRLIAFLVGEGGNYPAVGSPVTVIVPAGSTYAQFSLITTPDAAGRSALPVTLTAQDGAAIFTHVVTLDSLLFSSLTCNPGSVIGGSPTTGTLTLSGPAPPGGLTVSTYSDPQVTLPVSITVLAGASSATFPVTTTPVSHLITVGISAISSDGINPYQVITSSLSLQSADIPTTTAALSGTKGQNDWYTGPGTFTLTATDTGGATVTGTYYSVDGGPQQTYSGPFVVTGEGIHTLTYHSVNSAGSVEATSTVSVKIDSTPPVSTASVTGSTVVLTASDAGSGVASILYSLDGSLGQFYTGPFVLTVGEHTVIFRGEDYAGNQEAQHTLSVTVAPPPALLTQVRYWPRTGFSSRMLGGKFQGSTDGVTYTTLATITRPPASGRWSAAAISTTVGYKYLRYLAPLNSYGNIAELEFDTGTGPGFTKLTGTYFGTRGSHQNRGNTFLKAFDGNGATFFDGPTGNGNFVGVALGG